MKNRIVRRKAYEWSLVYDPDAGGGRGAITVTLGDKSANLELKPGQKAEGAKLYMHDLTCMGSKPRRVSSARHTERAVH